MEYLSLDTIESLKENIEDEMKSLLANKALVTKPDSLQWKFFGDCCTKLFNPHLNSEFNNYPNVKTAQLKFEAEDKLRKFYLRPGCDINFVFQIKHKRDLKNIFFDEADTYPDIGGYSLLIRDTSHEVLPQQRLTEKEIQEYIERVVTEAIEKEFEAYRTLPQIIEDNILDKWFFPEGPAKKEIMHVLLRHKERGWIISNPMNPSTKRVLSLKIKKIEKEEVFVSTTEYWYLRWWNTKENSYAYPYRETNRQQYILRKDKDLWKVYETIRPYPRTSIPNRRKY